MQAYIKPVTQWKVTVRYTEFGTEHVASKVVSGPSAAANHYVKYKQYEYWHNEKRWGRKTTDSEYDIAHARFERLHRRVLKIFERYMK